MSFNEKQIVVPRMDQGRDFKNMTQIYIIKQDMRIYVLPLAGQTAGPIGLKFCADTHGWSGCVIG